MSSTTRQGDRLSRYYTDPRVAAACVAALPEVRPGWRILDPHAGGGAWLEAVLEREPGAFCHAHDLDPGAAAVQPGQRWRTTVGDFLEEEGPRWSGIDLVVGNPPYSVDGVEVATIHLRRALEVAPRVAWLLPLDLLGGHRALPERWRAIPAAVWPVYPRPSFTGGKTDSGEYGFMLFERGSGDTIEWGRAIRWRPNGR